MKMNIPLTAAKTTTIISSPLPHEAVEIGLSEIIGIGRKQAVFLCEKSQFFIMLDWARQSKDWLGSLIPVDQLRSVRLHDWSHAVGFKTLSTEAIMPKVHAPKPSINKKLTNNVSKKSISRFNVLTKSGRSIARKIPFKEAVHLKNAQPELFIKFDSMVGVL
ncbi:MAG: hypothetical protein QM500_11205 [Methylococcales bacterium]